MTSNFTSTYGEVCVSLDLETTGLVTETDEIVEVGAVKFQGDQVLDTFQAMVNPYKTLSQFIKELTGITQAEVDAGSSFATVAPQLESFIGNNPIVGQNIAFDLAFLAKGGMNLSNRVYDTREMASVLLPRHREYSLLPLAASLGISHPRPHRGRRTRVADRRRDRPPRERGLSGRGRHGEHDETVSQRPPNKTVDHIYVGLRPRPRKGGFTPS